MSNRNLTGLCIAAIALALTSAGCDTVKAPPAVGRDTIPYGTYPQVVALGGLNAYLGVDPPIVEASTEQRPLRVTVPVRSLADTPMEVQYRFLFSDHTGRFLNPDQGWIFQHMSPRIQVQMRADALNTTAVNWRLEIRPAV